MKKRVLSPKVMGETFVVFLLALILLSGCTQRTLTPGATPKLSPPVVSISPASPLESDFQQQYSSFKLVATANVTDSAAGPFAYSYQWFKNGEMIQGATSNELPASLMGQQGHTVRGYEFKCQVTDADSQGNKAIGETAAD